MERVLVTGALGMLGSEVARSFSRDFDVVAVDIGEFDISDPAATGDALRDIAPDLVVNCAAYTDVDGAESERALADAVNGSGPGNLAHAARDLGARLVHVSTDYVFDGTSDQPYRENDPTCPVNAYGASKLMGERTVAASGAETLIVRTSWLYGRAGRNFVETMLRLAAERDELRVVDDQIGAPTYARDLADVMLTLVGARATGIVHATNSGTCSWCGFAREIFEASGLSPTRVRAVDSDAFPRPAARPRYSVLSLERLTQITGRAPRDWRAALRDYLRERNQDGAT